LKKVGAVSGFIKKIQ
jgi:hypothetical protein